MGEFRLVRLGEQIRGEISKMLLSGQIKDPRVSSFLSINRVDVSADLGYAKVYVSSFMQDKSVEKGVKGLQSAAGYIQSTIGKKLTIRQFPKLTFTFFLASSSSTLNNSAGLNFSEYIPATILVGITSNLVLYLVTISL